MSFRSRALALLASEGKAALVTLSRVQGSSPREEGAQMLVAASGFIGSIGGGTLEWQAMAEAQRRLTSPQPELRFERTYSLGPDLGQCCGGRVTITTEVITSEAELGAALTPEPAPTRVVLYGAGHVGKSLVLLLAQSPFAVTWIDTRPGAFPAATPPNVTTHSDLALPQDASFVIVMSHSHALDFEVTDASLRRTEIERVLLIGSDTKRARFLSRLKSAGHSEEALARLICPIGDGKLTSKTPYAVALSTAHQLTALDESLAAAQRGTRQGRERLAV